MICTITKTRCSFLLLLCFAVFLLTSCLRKANPDERKSFWFNYSFVKDTILYPWDGDTTLAYNITEYYEPLSKGPYFSKSIVYEFGFKHVIDTLGRKLAVFYFDYNAAQNRQHFHKAPPISGLLISDTSFFIEGEKYHYNSYVDTTCYYPNGIKTNRIYNTNISIYWLKFIDTPAFWYSFTKSPNDSTAYSFNFEFDNLIKPLGDNTYSDTVRFRCGRINVSKKYEKYCEQKRDYFRYHNSEGFIK